MTIRGLNSSSSSATKSTTTTTTKRRRIAKGNIETPDEDVPPIGIPDPPITTDPEDEETVNDNGSDQTTEEESNNNDNGNDNNDENNETEGNNNDQQQQQPGQDDASQENPTDTEQDDVEQGAGEGEQEGDENVSGGGGGDDGSDANGNDSPNGSNEEDNGNHQDSSNTPNEEGPQDESPQAGNEDQDNNNNNSTPANDEDEDEDAQNESSQGNNDATMGDNDTTNNGSDGNNQQLGDQSGIGGGDDNNGEDGNDAKNENNTVEQPPSPTLTNTINVQYIIGIFSEGSQQRSISYIDDLEHSMDILATDLLKPDGIDLQLPSEIESILDVECPPHVNPYDECKGIKASLDLSWEFDDGLSAFNDASIRFQLHLTRAIESQELQDVLDIVNPDSKVYIVTGTEPVPMQNDNGDGKDKVDLVQSTNNSRAPQESSPSIGAFLGMIAAGLCMALLVFGLFLYRRKNHLREFRVEEGKDTSDIGTDVEDGRVRGSATSSSNGLSPNHEGEDDAEHHNFMDDISSMASSAISYLGYTTTPNTPSKKDSNNDEKEKDKDNQQRHIILSQGSRDMSELDEAIKNGDWATAGSTARMLAADFSYDASSIGGSYYQPNMQSTINPSRAAELDRWIEAGDWEAVVLATSRYDNEEGSVNQYLPTGLRTATTVMPSPSNLEDDGASRISYASSRVSLVSIVESVHSALGYKSISHPPPSGDNRSLASLSTSTRPPLPLSQEQSDKIREEIEVLVRDVVPEEIDNVDELMAHFIGKEDELLDTLRTMQSRFVNQRARLARQTPPETVTTPAMAPATTGRSTPVNFPPTSAFPTKSVLSRGSISSGTSEDTDYPDALLPEMIIGSDTNSVSFEQALEIASEVAARTSPHESY